MTPQEKPVAWRYENLLTGHVSLMQERCSTFTLGERTYKETPLYAAPVQPVPAAQAEQPATITECEACFTPDVCQLRGKCDHYAAERIRVQKAERPAKPPTYWKSKTMDPCDNCGQLWNTHTGPLWKCPVAEQPASHVLVPVNEHLLEVARKIVAVAKMDMGHGPHVNFTPAELLREAEAAIAAAQEQTP